MQLTHFVMKPYVMNLDGSWTVTDPDTATHWGFENAGMILIKESKEEVMRALGQLTSIFDHLDDTEALWKETGRRP